MLDADPEAPRTKAALEPSAMGGLTDTIANSDAVPANTVEVMVLDGRSNAANGVHVELLRDRQSVTEGNTASKWQAVTDVYGNVRFADLASGSDSQYRVVLVENETRYGTRYFPLDSRIGTKVIVHAYPVVTDLKEAIVLGRTFVFVEPLDNVLSVEYMQEFNNLGRTVLVANELALRLPATFRAFSSNQTDADLGVVKTVDGVALVGAIAPGRHAAVFTFQVPTSNRDRIELGLALWPNTAEAQVATLARPGLDLDVDGYPQASVTEGNSRQPLLVTARSYAQEQSAPASIGIELAGLPTVGPGRWVAAAAAAFLAFAALLQSFLRRGATWTPDEHAAARERIVNELVALERAHRHGQIGHGAFTDARETLLSAFVRAARESPDGSIC